MVYPTLVELSLRQTLALPAERVKDHVGQLPRHLIDLIKRRSQCDVCSSPYFSFHLTAFSGLLGKVRHPINAILTQAETPQHYCLCYWRLTSTSPSSKF